MNKKENLQMYLRLKEYKKPEIGTIIMTQVYDTRQEDRKNWNLIGFLNQGDTSKSDWSSKTQVPLVDGMELQLLKLDEGKVFLNDYPTLPFIVSLKKKSRLFNLF